MKATKGFAAQTSPKTRQERMPLFEALIRYAQQDVVPFDVPGHKMGAQMNPLKETLGDMALRMDVNSMKELDLLSHPQSVIKEAQELAAEAFGADHAYFLVNGTTVGIQAMIMAACKPGDTLLVPRNAHKSVMDGIIMSGTNPIFIQPEVDYRFGIAHSVTAEKAEALLDAHPETSAILITYPTYFGSVGELETICKAAHKRGVAVLVDSAHGAHLRFLPGHVPDALEAGADAVTVSMHKTGGSLTQSSLLLVQGERVNPERIQKMLGMLQTTSANYLLMGSLDAARRELALHGHEQYEALQPLVFKAAEEIEAGGCYEILKTSYMQDQYRQVHDWTKLVIRVNGLGMSGFDVYTLLKEKYGIQMELAEGYVVMAVVTSADTEQSLGRLVEALQDIERCAGEQPIILSTYVTADQENELAMTPRDAFYAEHETAAIDDAIGRISADTLMIYPPGIPLVIPGERISEDMVKQYHYYSRAFGQVLTESKKADHITIVKGECK